MVTPSGFLVNGMQIQEIGLGEKDSMSFLHMMSAKLDGLINICILEEYIFQETEFLKNTLVFRLDS